MRKFLSLLAVLVLFSSLAFSQTKNVSGRITDQTGLGIPFASVRIKGTKVGVSADAEGNYIIRAQKGDVLEVTATGIAPQDFTVGNDASMPIAVTRKVGNLSEVVVTALGIKREARALGYSTATVSSEALNTSKPINVNAGLIGQVSGAQVSIINNGVDPQIRVQLRGERHIIADNQPLFIVDGMEVNSDFIITINPEDIETMTVLKSASAAALYGSEASNGVIIYTTKKGGKNNKPVINLQQTVTAETLAYIPKLQNQFGGYGNENGTYLIGTPYQFTAIDPNTGFANRVPFENQQYGPAFDGSPYFIGIPNEQGQVDSVPYAPQSKSAIQQFMQTGWQEQTDLSLTTGDAKNSNYVGLQYVNVDGTTPKDQSQRTSVRFGGKRTIGIFSYDYSANYSYKYSNTVGNDITAGWPIYWTLLNTPANIPLNTLKDWQDPTSWGNLSNYYNAYYINPYWQLDNSRQIQKQDALQGVLSMNLKPTDWFNLNYRISTQYTGVVYEGYRNAATFTPYSMQATSPASGIYGTPSSGDISGALLNQTITTKRIQQDIVATFQKKYGDLSATLLIGNTIWERALNQQTQGVGNNIAYSNMSTLAGLFSGTGNPQSQTSGLTIPQLYNIAYQYGNISAANEVENTRLIGYYSDLTLGYQDVYFLHGNFRRDYSSLLATANNSYDVYGVDASIIFSELIPGLKNSSVLSFGKIRGAYSHTGQITLSPYSTTNTFNVATGYPYGGLAGLTLAGQYNNPANTPEATNEFETGIELGFWNNRLNVGATYYHDNNYNQLFPVDLSSSTGFTSANVNAANTISEGLEFDVKATVIKNKDFRWDFGGNLAIQTTTVESLYGTGSNKTLQTGIGNNNEAIVGMSFPQLYVTDLLRDSANGKVIVDAKTGLPTVAPNLVAAGRTTPKYIVGFTSTFVYKRFTLNVIADYRGGYVFYNASERSLDFTGASSHTVENGRQNFVFPNSEILQGGKYVPNTATYVSDGSINFWVNSPFTTAQTPYVENAAAFKLRTLSLSYDFGQLIANQNIIKGLKLTATCNNVMMLRPKENNFTDPEFNYSNSNGLGNNTIYQLPPSRTYSLIASFTF